METIQLKSDRKSTTTQNTNDFLMLTNYDTFIDVKQSKNNNNLFIIDEDSLKEYSTSLQLKISKYTMYNYLLILIEIISQFLLIQLYKKKSYQYHLIFLLVFLPLTVLTIRFNSIYMFTLFECYICFIISMDIWLTAIHPPLLLYLIEIIGDYLVIKVIIYYQNQYNSITI